LLFIPSIKSEVPQLSDRVAGSRLSPLQVLQRFNPSKTLKLFLKREVLLADLACGFLAVLQYGLLTSVRHVINPRFNLSTPLISGLFYLSPGIGFIVGSLVGGQLSDRTVKRWISKRNGQRLPRDRLNSGIIHFFAVIPISTLLFGWSLQKEFGGLALVICLAFWIGVGLMGAYNGLNTYTAGKFVRGKRRTQLRTTR
jgi:MFS family permease